MPKRAAPAIALALAIGACPGTATKSDSAAPGKAVEITLFFVTELKGTIEPCGCTSDPLGDLARTTALINKVKGERPVALFDGGSTLYTEVPLPPAKRTQEQLKADLIAAALPKLGLAGMALGPNDLAAGKERVQLPRQIANVADPALPVEAPKVIEIGGAKIGVFGVVDPELVAPLGLQASDPSEAARTAIAALRGKGAEVVVALAHMPRTKARKLAREAPGADLILVGHDAPEPTGRRPLVAVEAASGAHLLQSHNRGQSILRVDLHLTGGGPIVDAIGEDRAAARIEELGGEIDALAAKVAAWEKDPSADAAFVEERRQELAALRAERDELRKRPRRVPEKGSWLVAAAVPIKKGLPCDGGVQDAKRAYDRAVGELNLAAAQGEKPAPVPAGGAGYVGIEECGFCHKAAVEFWSATRHAGGWETLVADEKQWNRDCIGCHVTGWLEPGGATLVDNERLRDIQCESCHGPASRHVDANGKEKPSSLVADPPADRCLGCHTPEHSDTFDYRAYLRDVTGPGHGEEYRKQLGDGPTGHELRTAAKQRAGAAIGAGCTK